MLNTTNTQLNPLSRRPRHSRIVVGLRGAPGVGKSHFVASMAEAGRGRLCVFDVERKMRLIEGVDSRFDAYEISDPDELPHFIDHFLTGAGKSMNYGCFALDSFAHYFAAKHAVTLEALRKSTGDPLARLDSAQMNAEQILLQGVLRKLTMTGKSVVITDLPVPKGAPNVDLDEATLTPRSIAGLESVVDILIELSLEMRDEQVQRVFQVIKSNSSAFPVGLEFVGDDVTFRTLLDHLGAPEMVETDSIDEPLLAVVAPPPPPPLSVNDLVARAGAVGITRPSLTVQARALFNLSSLYRLNQPQLARLAAWIEREGALKSVTVPECAIALMPQPSPDAAQPATDASCVVSTASPLGFELPRLTMPDPR